MDDSKKQEIGEAFLKALKEQDWEVMRGLLAQDITWSLPGASTISGQAVGVDAVIAGSQRITSYGLDFKLNRILYGQFGFALRSTIRLGAACWF